jgi:16S rRNA (uracil1498-N3)-methyltransferase
MLYSYHDGNLTSPVQLSDAESHHLVLVRRAKAGEAVTILDGRGHTATGRLVKADSRRALVDIDNIRTMPRTCAPLWLAQAMPLGKTMDTIVQKAAELGAERIIPLCTERSELRMDAERTAHKLEKWRQAAVEAVKQCGNPFLPAIDSPMTIAELVRLPLPTARAVCSLEADARAWLPFITTSDTRIGLVTAIGPEGDFTPAEYAALREAGFAPVSLGPLVLRSDTAAIVSLAIASEAMRKDLPFAD